MNPRTQAVLVDTLLGCMAVAVGVVVGGVRSSWFVPLFVIVGTAVFVPVLYVTEQTNLLAAFAAYKPHSVVLVFSGFLAISLVLVGGQAVAVDPAASLLIGMGAGLIGYRVRYGVLGPLPQKRLRQARLVRGSDWLDRDNHS